MRGAGVKPGAVTGAVRRDAGSLFEPEASYESASPGHSFGPAAQTHDRRDDPAAARTHTSRSRWSAATVRSRLNGNTGISDKSI